MVIDVKYVLLGVLVLAAGACSRQEAYPCDGRFPAEAVMDMNPVVEEFRSHLVSTNGGTELDEFLSDYHHYDLRIKVTESEYVYVFLPNRERPDIKGGGARYSVSRKTGRIEGKEYFK